MKNAMMSGIGLLLLTACAVGPNYHRPPTVVPDKFKEATGKAFIVRNHFTWKIATPNDAAKRGRWWEVFHDQSLNALEEVLNRDNQSVANAVSNYFQALAIVDEARASYYPVVVGDGTIFRQTGNGSTSFISSSTSGTTTGVASSSRARIGAGTISTNYNVFLNANWEPDIWGLVKRTVESDLAAAEANQALIAATRLSAQGSLAQYYYQVRTLDADQKLLDETVKSYQQALQLTRNQYASGVASQADIVQAQSQLENAQALALNNGILRGQYEHAIAVLMGRPPANFSLAYNPLPVQAKPPVIPVMIPTQLLERRPDIAQAERVMQQTNAQIGVAIAAYFPVINLSASISGSWSSLPNLLNLTALGWSYGIEGSQTFYDGGLRSAAVRAANAGYMAAVANYRQAVLTAFQDVEDNLTSTRILKEQVIFQNQAAASAQKALKLVINQYKAGTVAYSSVITAQIVAYNAQKTANDTVGLQMTAAVRLIKALGGGWDAVIDLPPSALTRVVHSTKITHCKTPQNNHNPGCRAT